MAKILTAKEARDLRVRNLFDQQLPCTDKAIEAFNFVIEEVTGVGGDGLTYDCMLARIKNALCPMDIEELLLKDLLNYIAESGGYRIVLIGSDNYISWRR